MPLVALAVAYVLLAMACVAALAFLRHDTALSGMAALNPFGPPEASREFFAANPGPYTQDPYPTFKTMQFVVRSADDPTRLVGPIQRAIASVDPDILLARIRTIDELVSDASANARLPR